MTTPRSFPPQWPQGRPVMALGLVLVLGSSLLGGASARAADLVVLVTNLDTKKGHMEAALYDEPEQFPTGKRRSGLRVPVTGNTVRLVFKNATVGRRYAVAVFHDENDNEEFDQGLFGVPLEGFGFSNDAGVLTGSPAFEECAFIFTKDKMEITVTLKHSVFD